MAPREQLSHVLVGTGQKCAKDPVNSAAGQTVMASAWSTKELCFAWLVVTTLCHYGAQNDFRSLV